MKNFYQITLVATLLGTVMLGSTAQARAVKGSVEFGEATATKVVDEMNANGCDLKVGEDPKACSDECTKWLKGRLAGNLSDLNSKDVKEAFFPTNSKNGSPFYSEIKKEIDGIVNDQLVAIKEDVESDAYKNRVSQLTALVKTKKATQNDREELSRLQIQGQFDLVELPRTYYTETNRLEQTLLKVMEEKKDRFKVFLDAMKEYPTIISKINDFCKGNEKASTLAGYANCTNSFPGVLLTTVQKFNKRFKPVIDKVDFASVASHACTGQAKLFEPYKVFLNKAKDKSFVESTPSYIEYAQLDKVDFDPKTKTQKDHKSDQDATTQVPKKTSPDLMSCVKNFNKKWEGSVTGKLDKHAFCTDAKSRDLVPNLDQIKDIYGVLNTTNYFSMLRMKLVNSSMEEFHKYAGYYPSESDLAACDKLPDLKAGIDSLRKQESKAPVTMKNIENNAPFMITLHDAAKKLIELRETMIAESAKFPALSAGEKWGRFVNEKIKKEKKYQDMFDQYAMILRTFPQLRADMTGEQLDISNPEHFYQGEILASAKKFAAIDVGGFSANDMTLAKVNEDGFDEKYQAVSAKLKEGYKSILAGSVNTFLSVIKNNVVRACTAQDDKANGITDASLLLATDLNQELVAFQPQYGEFYNCALAKVQESEFKESAKQALKSMGCIIKHTTTLNGSGFGLIDSAFSCIPGDIANSIADYDKSRYNEEFVKGLGLSGKASVQEVADAANATRMAWLMLGAAPLLSGLDYATMLPEMAEGARVAELLEKNAKFLVHAAEHSIEMRSAILRLKGAKNMFEAEKALSEVIEIRANEKMILREIASDPAKVAKITDKALLELVKGGQPTVEKLEGEIAADVVLKAKLNHPEEFSKLRKSSEIEKIEAKFEKDFGQPLSKKDKDAIIGLELAEEEKGISKEQAIKDLIKVEEDAACMCAKKGCSAHL